MSNALNTTEFHINKTIEAVIVFICFSDKLTSSFSSSRNYQNEAHLTITPLNQQIQSTQRKHTVGIPCFLVFLLFFFLVCVCLCVSSKMASSSNDTGNLVDEFEESFQVRLIRMVVFLLIGFFQSDEMMFHNILFVGMCSCTHQTGGVNRRGKG